MSNNLNIDLQKREDKNGKTFYIGKITAPCLIDLSNGATFLVFVSDDGCEQLQIAQMNSGKRQESNE